MKPNTSPLTQQLLKMRNDGLSFEEISSALQASGVNLLPEAIELAINTALTSKRMSADQLIERYRNDMINVLYEIASDESKNESARVKAATVIVKREGCLPVMEATDLTEAFTRMRNLVNQNKPKELVESFVDV
jgi:hypothetical protein